MIDVWWEQNVAISCPSKLTHAVFENGSGSYPRPTRREIRVLVSNTDQTGPRGILTLVGVDRSEIMA